MTDTEAIKTFFSTPSKPVTVQELIELKRTDKEGYEELGKLCRESLESKGK